MRWRWSRKSGAAGGVEVVRMLWASRSVVSVLLSLSLLLPSYAFYFLCLIVFLDGGSADKWVE